MVRRLKKDILTELPDKVRQQFILSNLDQTKMAELKKIWKNIQSMSHLNREDREEMIENNEVEDIRLNMMDL